jgi:hypothetical protein
MKNFAAVMILVMATAGVCFSQNINWRSLGEDQRNVVQLGFGYDYAVTAQLAYGRTFSWIRPVMLRLDYSFPMGEDLLDDFKVRLGGQMEIVKVGGFSATVRILANLRRYQATLVRIVSFGSDLALLAGYYKPTWHAAGEFGFDKSITSYLKHSDVMKANFPGIRDGWYIPTGGHYYYGIQAGKTIGESFDLSLRLGATNAQDNNENDMVPYYLQLGMGMRF